MEALGGYGDFPALDAHLGTSPFVNVPSIDFEPNADPLHGVGAFLGTKSYAWDEVIEAPLDINFGTPQPILSSSPNTPPHFFNDGLVTGTPADSVEYDTTSAAVWNALQAQSNAQSAPANYGLLSLPEQWNDTCPVSLPALVAQTVPFTTPEWSPGRLKVKDTFVWNNDQFDAPLKLFSVSTPVVTATDVVPAVEPVVSRVTAESTSLEKIQLATQQGVDMGPVRRPSIAANAVPALATSAKRRARARLYECPICHKMFERSYNQRMHLDTHEAMENRLKPFICPFPGCGKQFARKHDKNRHYQGVHLRARKTAPSTSPVSVAQSNTVALA